MSRPVAIITARSGSKGLKDKNMLFLGDKPLLIHSVDAAIDSGKFKPGDIYLSTDSKKYKRIVEYLRPEINVILRKPELALDTTTSFEVLADFLADFEDDQIFMLLQPTSPLRSKEDICAAFDMLNDGAEAVVSFSRHDKGLDFYTRLDDNGIPIDLVGKFSNYRRQDAEVMYAPNGSIFLAKKIDYLREGTFFYSDTRALITASENSIDIDGISDFKKALGVFNFNFLNCSDLGYGLNLLKPINSTCSGDVVIFADFRTEFTLGGEVAVVNVGWMPTGRIADILPEFLSTNRSRRVILSIGTSDVIRGVSGEVFAHNIRRILGVLKRYDVMVEVLPLAPVLYRYEIDNLKIREFNEILHRTCRGFAVIIDDFLPEILDEDGDLMIEYTVDGLRLNREGGALLCGCIL